MRAVIYARYSSHSQTEQSIEGQMHACTAYAKAHDFTVVNTYIDRALTGKTDKRPEFQQMIKDSAKHSFDFVILYKIDRFARNRYDSAIYKAKLKKNGVKVLSAAESIPDGPEGIMLESLLEGMAEYFSADLSQKVIRGMKENAIKGLSLGGAIPYGYKTINKKFEIDPIQAPTIKYIFTEYANGTAIKEICNELNTRGIKTKSGNAWVKNSLARILKNQKYLGIYETHGETHTIPSIIDQETFNIVQERVEINKHSRRGKYNIEKPSYLLSGKLYCGLCGAGMTGVSGTSRNREKYYYYTCTNRRQNKNCKKEYIRKNSLETLVVRETMHRILNPEKIKQVAKNCMDVYQREFAQNNELLYLQKNLVEITKSINNMLNAIEQGIITPTTKKRLMDLENNKIDLEYKISEESTRTPELTEEHIIFMLSKFQRGSDELFENYQEELIDCFINSVYLYEDHLYITYNLSNEKNSDLERSEL